MTSMGCDNDPSHTTTQPPSSSVDAASLDGCIPAESPDSAPEATARERTMLQLYILTGEESVKKEATTLSEIASDSSPLRFVKVSIRSAGYVMTGTVVPTSVGIATALKHN